MKNPPDRQRHPRTRKKKRRAKADGQSSPIAARSQPAKHQEQNQISTKKATNGTVTSEVMFSVRLRRTSSVEGVVGENGIFELPRNDTTLKRSVSLVVRLLRWLLYNISPWAVKWLILSHLSLWNSTGMQVVLCMKNGFVTQYSRAHQFDA